MNENKSYLLHLADNNNKISMTVPLHDNKIIIDNRTEEEKYSIILDWEYFPKLQKNKPKTHKMYEPNKKNDDYNNLVTNQFIKNIFFIFSGINWWMNLSKKITIYLSILEKKVAINLTPFSFHLFLFFFWWWSYCYFFFLL